MRKQGGRRFYIVAECTLNLPDWTTVRKPVLLYSDGTFEVQDVPDTQTKDYSRYKRWKQLYIAIEKYMDDYIKNDDRDVRSHFFPTRTPLSLLSVLREIPSDQASVKLHKLWQFYYRHHVEREIYEALWRLHLKLPRKHRIMMEFACRLKATP